MNLKLVRATETDAEKILALVRPLVSRTYQAAENIPEILEELNQGPIFLVCVDGEVVGLVSYKIEENGAAYISEVAITSSHQRKGYARRALELMLHGLAGVPSVRLMTHPENIPAMKLYESLGFRATGKRIEDCFGDGEPRIELVLDQ